MLKLSASQFRADWHLRFVNLNRSGSLIQAGLLACIFLLASCQSPTQRNSEAPASNAPPPNYGSKIGVAVRTASHACVQIANANLAPDSPITLVVPTSPQSFTQAQIKAPSNDSCPITKDLNANASSYEISLPADSNIPKQVPMIAVAGTSSPFTMQNGSVTADPEQNGQHWTFRECTANDGIYLSVWGGAPLASAFLWHGHYYEAGNPELGPACTAREMAGS